MATIILGIAGKRGTGKTSAATYLHDIYRFKIISFASRLKEVAEWLHPGIGHWKKEAPKLELNGQTPREYYISLGAHERFYDPDYWVKESGVANAIGRIAIDDVRFPNEVDYLKKLGAKVVRLNRFEKLNIYGKDLDDISETALDDFKGFDYIVQDCRNCTMPDLKREMDIIMENMGLI